MPPAQGRGPAAALPPTLAPAARRDPKQRCPAPSPSFANYRRSIINLHVAVAPDPADQAQGRSRCKGLQPVARGREERGAGDPVNRRAGHGAGGEPRAGRGRPGATALSRRGPCAGPRGHTSPGTLGGPGHPCQGVREGRRAPRPPARELGCCGHGASLSIPGALRRRGRGKRPARGHRVEGPSANANGSIGDEVVDLDFRFPVVLFVGFSLPLPREAAGAGGLRAAASGLRGANLQPGR